jgi:hypothetical protein
MAALTTVILVRIPQTRTPASWRESPRDSSVRFDPLAAQLMRTAGLQVEGYPDRARSWLGARNSSCASLATVRENCATEWRAEARGPKPQVVLKRSSR